MTFPTIHLNGTPLRDLIKRHEKAFEYIQDAMTMLCDCRPNGRDYYHQGHGFLDQALTEAFAREAKLQAVLDELGQILNYLDLENTKREEGK